MNIPPLLLRCSSGRADLQVGRLSVSLVPICVTVTAAPGTAAPEASVMLPTMEPKRTARLPAEMLPSQKHHRQEVNRL